MSDIRIVPLTQAIGAEMFGVDLREPLSAESSETLERALETHLVLLFRDQPLAPEELIAFGRQLGELQVHPFAPPNPDFPEMIVLDQVNPVGEGADNWHADATFQVEPPGFEILQAVQLPAVGGDTLFASMFAAFEAFSPPIQGLLSRLRGAHDLTVQLKSAIDHGYSAKELKQMRERWPEVLHPVARTHPLTGRKALFVNRNYTTRIDGLTDVESERLLHFLFEHIRSPQFQVRIHWEVDTVVVWDNRYCQHTAIPDYHERRVLHRLNLTGDKPI